MKKLLLIEDDKDMRENTAEILELANFQVSVAGNGREGVEQARKDPPDLILCDIMMPEMDGYGVLHLLSRDPRTAEIPFIFLSAKSERSDVRKGMEMGADDYLTKPFEESELLNAIDGRLKRSGTFRKGFDQSQDGFDRFLEEARGVNALRDILQDRRSKTMKKKDSIFFEGDELSSVHFISRGKVRTYKMNEDGKELVTGLYGSGDFLGYGAVLEGGPSPETAEALEETETLLIPRDDLMSLMYKDRDVSMRFIKMLTREVKEKEKELLDMAYAPVRQRVARALIRLHRRFHTKGKNDLGLKISREDLASIVGTATESLIRCLSDLKNDKLISTSGRNIDLIDLKGLERAASGQ